MSIFSEGWDDLKRGAGDLVSDGAHVLGDGLNAVGLHGAANAVETEGTKIGYDLGSDVPELQLGQTTDPAELVHGDPAAIAAAAQKLTTFSSAFGKTADGLKQIDTGHWEGAAADAFRAKFATEPAKWSAASEAMGKASAALQSYAGTVESAQGQARQAIDLWEEGQQATAAATAAYNQQVAAYNSAAQAYNARLAAGQNPGTRPTRPGSFTDPGEPLRQEAQQILDGARAARNEGAASAQAAVEAATQLAPAEPSFWSQAVDDLSDTFQVGQLAGVSFTSGVLEGTADIGKFVRSVNPDDPWNLAHPAEYLAGLSGTLAGLTDAVVDPEDLLKAVAGSGWSTDPAEAFGKLVPNIALTLATDGGGAAADAADAGEAGASVSEDVASQGVQDMTRVGDPVNVATGDVVFAQADVSLPGAFPLVLERVHKSSWRGGRWLGQTWASSFDQRLLVTGDRIAGVFADGRVLVWPRDPGPARVLPVAGPEWPLRREIDGSYTVNDPQNGLTWRYADRPGFAKYAGDQGELPLVEVTDRAGHAIAFGYGAAGQPETVTHSGGYRIDVAVTGRRVTGLTLGGVPLVSYEYDEQGNLTGVVNSSGRPLRFTYDDAGRMTGWTDRGGRRYRYLYDEQGRCVRGESPSGAMSATFGYAGGLTRHTDAEGAVTEYWHHGTFRIESIKDPLGNVTRFERDARGRVTARTDALGRVTRYRYDARGNLVAVTRPDGGVARADYDDRCLPVTVTEAGGAVWRQSYDERGNRTELAAPDGAVTRYGYDERGHLASVTGPDGAPATMACDATGLPVAVTGPDGSVSRYQRDQFGRIGRITGPDGGVTSLTWTIEGRPLSRTLPGGAAESWHWDADGHLLRHVSPAGAVTSYEYGPFDTVTAARWPDGTRTEFGYDRELRLESVTHGGLTWRYAYDPAGRLVRETDFNGATTLFLNDPCSRPIRRLTATGQETAYDYDALGNLTSLRTPDGSATTFGYDEAGRLVRARNASAEISLARDALGRVTAETCDGRTVRTSYDAAGRMTERVTPSGAVSTWSYDAGLPSAVASGGQEIRFGYGPGGREVRRELPGGLTLTQEWDPAGRLAGQTLTGPGPGPGSWPGAGPGREGPGAPGQVLQRRSYAYTPDGLLAGIGDLLRGTRSFGLDAAGRVTAITGLDWTEQYSYDSAGNVASATWPVPPGTALPWLEHGPQGPREVTGTLVTRAGNVRYRHDAAGRVIARTRTRISRKPETWRYEWDAENRLTAVSVPDGSTWRYSYDPLGRRIAKQHVTADGQLLEETRFAWSGAVLAEQESSGRTGTTGTQVTTWDYRPGTFAPLTQVTRTQVTSTAVTRASLRDAPQEVIDERFHAIVTDLTGMPAELVAPDGTLAGYQQHTLWGGTTWRRDGASTPLRFPGQYEDPETGLHYNNQRYYDPVTGAYLSPDPLGLAPGPNPHAYVPNPHVLVDPLGLEPGGAARNAPDFSVGPSGAANDLRGIGRPDNELVLSGHGGIRTGDGTPVTVPQGTSVAMYSVHGDPISDALGNSIETGSPTPLEVYGPGEQVPDYWLMPPKGLNILGLPRTVIVDTPTRLSDLLAPNMGRIHWAACRVVASRLW